MPSILIIDDEKLRYEMLDNLFTNEGFRVPIAYDGGQGIRVARAHHPDIILSDVRMPGISRHEAVAPFRQIPGLAATPGHFDHRQCRSPRHAQRHGDRRRRLFG